MKRFEQIARLIVAVCTFLSCALVGYVAWQWPDKAKELDIPVGRIRTMPGGGNLKGICVQGEPGGLSLWYRVTPLTSNELVQQQALFKAIQDFK